jgi:hypothetical protein
MAKPDFYPPSGDRNLLPLAIMPILTMGFYAMI